MKIIKQQKHRQRQTEEPGQEGRNNHSIRCPKLLYELAGMYNINELIHGGCLTDVCAIRPKTELRERALCDPLR